MNKNEDKFIHDGIIYITAAAEDIEEAPCEGCVGRDDELCLRLPPCGSGWRRDGQNVVWIEAGTAYKKHRRNA